MRLAFFLLIFAGACGFALWKGGMPERIVSLTFIGGLAGTALLRSPVETRFGSFEAGIFLIDLAMLCSITVVALYSERFWPLWLSAFQAIQVLSHLPEAIIPHLLPTTYLVIVSVWAYPMLLILLIGTVRHRNRLVRYGTDASWSVS